MKKLLCLILVLILSVSVITACGNNDTKTLEAEDDVVTTSNEKNEDKEDKKEDAISPDATPAKEDAKKDTVSEKNNDKTEALESETDKKQSSSSSSDFYLILNGTNEENILYHVDGCPLLKDKEIQKTSWEMIEMLQFRHCAKCNPPKYKGYVE